MIKDGNNITTNLVYEANTEEKNGLQVEITDIKDISPYISGLKYVLFFPNLYVDYKSKYFDNCSYKYININDVTIKHFNNFACANVAIDTKVLLGNVLYPLDKVKIRDIDSSLLNFLYIIKDSGVVLKFNIGELKITPNREELIYDSETIKVIENRIKEAKIELYELVRKSLKKDYDDIFEYCSVKDSYIYYDVFKNTSYLKYTDSSTTISDNLKGFELDDYVTFKGKTLDDNTVRAILSISNIDNDWAKGFIWEGIYTTSTKSWKFRDYIQLGSKYEFIVLKDVKVFSSIMKSYLKEKCYKILICSKKPTYEEFKSYIINTQYQYNNLSDDIYKEIYDSCFSKAIYEDFTSKEFLKYKESVSNDVIKSTNKDYIIYVFNTDTNNRYFSLVKKYKTFDSIIKYIKNLKRGVVINNIDKNNEDYYKNICSYRNYAYISANKQIISKLNKVHFINRVDLSTLIGPNHFNKVINTINTLLSFNSDTFNSEILKSIPEPLYSEIKTLQDLTYTISTTCANSIGKFLTPYDIDDYTKYICIKYNKYKTIYNNVLNESHLSSTYKNYNESLTSVLVYTSIVKNKLYRINSKKYQSLKKIPLIKLLYAKKDNI